MMVTALTVEDVRHSLMERRTREALRYCDHPCC
eukprot:COSAG06_NODE_66605_length_254_cov_0.574194_1_plen_32_part_10